MAMSDAERRRNWKLRNRDKLREQNRQRRKRDRVLLTFGTSLPDIFPQWLIGIPANATVRQRTPEVKP